MQIEIDFDVYKALTARRENEQDTYNQVIRRLLDLPPNPTLEDAYLRPPAAKYGLWVGKVHLPNGTALRGNYKGKTYLAEIREGEWLGEDGKTRQSPSEAASTVCNGTNVNGWRFWYAKRPGETEWHRLDQLR